MHSTLVGVGLGFLAALQLGPMSLFLIRSTLRAGLLAGGVAGVGLVGLGGVLGWQTLPDL